MTAIPISYPEARKLMQPGDVIAFSGKTHFSEIIKFATCSAVSHVGVVLHTRIPDAEPGRFFNQIIESTTINQFSGVSISRLSERIEHYQGDLWWLPLRKTLRKTRFNSQQFYEFLFNQSKKPYDLPQALLSAVDTLDKLPFDTHGPGYNNEDFSKFFCSELVAAGLEAAGTVGKINASEVTPIDLCRWAIYEKNYYLLKGTGSKSISRFNTASPKDWNY